MDESIFKPTPIIQIRAPLHEWDHVVTAPFPDSRSQSFTTESLLQYLRSPRTRLFEEALRDASPDLYAFMERASAGAKMKESDVRRAAVSLAKYQLRAAGRSTPFGLMAGVGAARIGTTTEIRMTGEGTKFLRPDHGWLMSLVRSLEADPGVCARISVQANNLAVRRGRRLFLLPTDVLGRELQGERSVRATPVAMAALRHSAELSPFGDVVEATQKEFPESPPGAVARLVHQLISLDFILTQLRPPADHPDPLGHLVGLAPEILDDRNLADVYACPERPLSSSSPVASKNKIVTDVRLDVHGTINRSVADDVAAAAEVLWNIAPHGAHSTVMDEFHLRFVEHYGHHHFIPLLEALDVERGIGVPADYRCPAEGTVSRPAKPRTTQREAILAEAAQAALVLRNELVLTPRLVRKLSGASASLRPHLPPLGTDIFCELVAPDADAVDRGDFEVILAPWPGGHAPAGAFGRFGHILGHDAMAAASSESSETIRAHLTYSPRGARQRNVTASHQYWLEHRIAVGEVRGERAGDIGLDDLYLVADDQGLRLYSRSHRAEVDAHVYSLSNPDFTPNVARFIQDVQLTGRRTWHPWDWGSLDALPALPRVRHGRVVVSPATWKCSADELKDRTLSWEDWRSSLALWRATWSVPTRLKIGYGDRWTPLDLSLSWHQFILREEINSQPDNKSVTVVEDLGALARDHGSFPGWLRGHTGPSGLVVSLQTPPIPRKPLRWVEGMNLRPSADPGHDTESWVYAKIHTNHVQEILENSAADLNSELRLLGVENWFFIRYTDGEEHLRIRAEAPREELRDQVRQCVKKWGDQLVSSGLARICFFAAYEPETHRYGGTGILEPLHSLFTADSDFVISVSQEVRKTEWARLAAHFYAMVRSIFARTPVDADEWLLRTLVKNEKGHRAFRASRKQILSLVASHDDPPFGSRFKERDILAFACAEYGQALHETVGPERTGTWQYLDDAVHGILHMHHNRLLGMDRESELNILMAGRGIAQAHQDRRNARGRGTTASVHRPSSAGAVVK
ncbi:lantibiotic dehydratase [Streptomyces sp. NPDC002159]